ncbi:hypothetical protein NCAS_0F00540 [Naumovozyma castellii]|uniref:Uncharacterized protein n=1 Tax=Naumovozyma castellii TaxID=27288 RepID=G0VGB8_NAUCA|nr:hypothetical protein NCAS_0F00540 [Naumovozyma castellii CBS 4309]CCC70538.1 hypothetical protein NCAS_0F00540 [Naumovozyma castellii CBS 4309]
MFLLLDNCNHNKMKLELRTYTEAHKYARSPRFKYLMYGMVATAILPTLYLSRHFHPHYDPGMVESDIPMKKEVIRSRTSKLFNNVLPSHKYVLDDDLTLLLFSSTI